MALSLANLLQDPPPWLAADDPTFWQWLGVLVREPGVIEVLLAATIVAVLLLVWWRLAALVQGARAREALRDYLLGVEQALQGDLVGAEKRLSRVLQQDPENHYARLLLGKVLGELGQAEQAHQQHLYLQRAFGLDSGENDLMLAQSLLGAGLPAEAADVAERALARAPNQAAGWDFVYRARLQSGDHEAAAAAGRRLLQLLREGDERTRLRRDLARTLAQAGTLRWLRGDAAAARRAAQEAQQLDRAAAVLPLLGARLQACAGGVEATAQTLLTTPPRHAGSLVPAAPAGRLSRSAGDTSSGAGKADDEVADGSQLPVATFAGLLESSRWSCRACGTALARAVGQCPRCGAAAPAELNEPRLVTALESTTEVMDRIDANEAHVQRLVRTMITGDARVREELLQLGERAVAELLRAAWKRSGDEQEQVLSVLREMGPTIAPALFAASDALAQQRLLSVGGKNPAVLVGRIVQSFDRTALPQVTKLFTSARPDHRKILIDYFLGLADVEAFQSVLERFPPMEILQGFNSAEAAVLERFLGAVPRGHFIAESLLLEPTFYRDEAVLAAVPGAIDPEALIDVLLRRGPTRTLTKVLIHAVGEPQLADTAERVLSALGEDVLEHVLAAYADPGVDAASRERLALVLVRGGAPAVVHVVDGFGPESTQLDDQLRRIVVEIGDVAIDALLGAYEHSGWLEKVSVGFISRHNNRRVQIVRALGELGSSRARAALKSLQQRERDDNLRLHLTRALHAAQGADVADQSRVGGVRTEEDGDGQGG